MKTINYKLSSIVVAIVVLLSSCSKDFLEVEPKGTSLENNYYQNQEQAFSGLVAVYDIMRKNSGGFENMNTALEVFNGQTLVCVNHFLSKIQNLNTHPLI